MKVAVFSDSHGNIEHMLTAIEDFSPDCVIHLGDVVRDADLISGHYPHLPLHSVSGNCDYAPTVPDSKLIELGGVRMFISHGHRHGVKLGLDSFLNSVYCSGAALGLFGHTHIPLCRDFGGIQLMNPGACGSCLRPTYGQILIENGAAFCKIVEIK